MRWQRSKLHGFPVRPHDRKWHRLPAGVEVVDSGGRDPGHGDDLLAHRLGCALGRRPDPHLSERGRDQGTFLGQPLLFDLGLALLRDIALDRHVAGDRSGLVEDRRGDRLFLVQHAVLATVGHRRRERSPARQGFPHGRIEVRAFDAALEEAWVRAEDLVAGIPGDPLERRVHVFDLGCQVGDDNGLGRLLDGGEQTLAFPFGDRPVCHVHDGPGQRYNVSVGVERHLAETADPARLAIVSTDDPVLPAKRLPPLDDLFLEVSLHSGLIVRMDQIHPRGHGPRIAVVDPEYLIEHLRRGPTIKEEVGAIRADERRLLGLPEEFLALPQVLLGLSTRGEIRGDERPEHVPSSSNPTTDSRTPTTAPRARPAQPRLLRARRHRWRAGRRGRLDRRPQGDPPRGPDDLVRSPSNEFAKPGVRIQDCAARRNGGGTFMHRVDEQAIGSIGAGKELVAELGELPGPGPVSHRQGHLVAARRAADRAPCAATCRRRSPRSGAALETVRA